MQILLFENCTPIPSVAVADLLRKAVDLAPMMGIPLRTKLEIQLLSTQGASTVTASGGITLTSLATTRDAQPGNVLIVPALDPDVLENLERNRSAVDFVWRPHASGADIVSVCTGAFILAEAGLLDGKQCATHWAFQELLAARYDKVRIVPEAIVVDHGRIVTSGGATSFITLALFLIERLLGEEVARASSKMFLVDVNKPPQSAYAMFSTQKVHGDQGIHAAQRAIEARLSPPPSIDELARVAGTSVRTFARRFQKATGSTPRDYIQRVRIEAAKRGLERSDDTVAEIAQHVGYSDPVAFRKLFIEKTGLTPTDYRERYGRRVAPAWLIKPISRRALS